MKITDDFYELTGACCNDKHKLLHNEGIFYVRLKHSPRFISPKFDAIAIRESLLSIINICDEQIKLSEEEDENMS